MRRPSIIPNTLLALQATEYAQQQGLFDPFHRAMYRAYWEDGGNLGDMEVIREVAEECGLDWRELEQRLKSGYYQEAVIGQYREALSLEVRGVPAFLIGNILFTGARPYEVFKAVAEKALGRQGPNPP
jgi:predicted DsbA family dithiol-disulfide isomerase